MEKLDGVEDIPNVLVVGMTNRREVLDRALLRPGRLEVQIEIPLPDVGGRREMLRIHFGKLRGKGRLSQPLCRAIDGVYGADGVLEDRIVVAGRKRRGIKCTVTKLLWALPGNSAAYAQYDLASDYATRGFSGADIPGLVRCARSIALSRTRKDGGGVEGLLIMLEDVK